MSRRGTERMEALLASVTPELLNAGLGELARTGLRVEGLLLELVRPDPVQPRRVLPMYVHDAFHQGHLTPTQALRELVKLAQVAGRQRGRPFQQVAELLSLGSEEEPEGAVTPEERLLRDLAQLAVTIRDDGQVNPLTVVDVSEGVTHRYRIETGERRYWATWLLRDFLGGYGGDGTIPCIVIPPSQASVFRQARENTARAGLSAVALARQAALLLLTVHGHTIPSYAVTNDFYRQALSLDLRGKHDHTDAVLSAMGGISRSRLSHFKSLLHLSDEALELADRHEIDEYRLRPVVSMPVELHAEIVRQIVDFKLTAKQVQELCRGEEVPQAADEGHLPLAASARKLAKLSRSAPSGSPQELVEALLALEGDPAVVQARLRGLRQWIEQAERHLEQKCLRA